MAEQLICNQQVDGSTPFASSNSCNIFYGGFPERPKGADCKSVVDDFAGPNPASPTTKKHPHLWVLFCASRMRLRAAFSTEGRKSGSLILAMAESASKPRLAKMPRGARIQQTETLLEHTYLGVFFMLLRRVFRQPFSKQNPKLEEAWGVLLW